MAEHQEAWPDWTGKAGEQELEALAPLWQKLEAAWPAVVQALGVTQGEMVRKVRDPEAEAQFEQIAAGVAAARELLTGMDMALQGAETRLFIAALAKDAAQRGAADVH